MLVVFASLLVDWSPRVDDGVRARQRISCLAKRHMRSKGCEKLDTTLVRAPEVVSHNSLRAIREMSEDLVGAELRESCAHLAAIVAIASQLKPDVYPFARVDESPELSQSFAGKVVAVHDTVQEVVCQHTKSTSNP